MTLYKFLFVHKPLYLKHTKCCNKSESHGVKTDKVSAIETLNSRFSLNDSNVFLFSKLLNKICACTIAQALTMTFGWFRMIPLKYYKVRLPALLVTSQQTYFN